MTDTTRISGVEPSGRVSAFLEAFARATAALDLDALGECFSPTFLVGDAGGGTSVSREHFLAVLPARAEAAARAGVGRAVLEAAEAVPLDDHWTVLRTRWSAPTRAGGELAMASTFVLHDDGERARAVAYLNHEGLPRRIGDSPAG